METATRVQGVDPPVPTGAALRMVLLPGRLERRAKAAASLPAWVVVVLAACLLTAGMELFVSTCMVLDSYTRLALTSIYQGAPLAIAPSPPAIGAYLHMAWGQMRPRVVPELVEDIRRIPLLLLLIGVFLGVLGLVGLLVVGTFGTSFGQRFWEAQRKAWRVVFVLGSVWLLQAVVIWTLICVIPGALAGWWLSTYRNMDYVNLALMFLFGVSTCLLLLQVWLVRLIRACSRLVAEPIAAPEARCGHCGYFLEGLAEGNGCPECGEADPTGADRLRQATVWVRRSEVGWWRGLVPPVVQVLVAPGRLFGQMQVLTDGRDARQFLVTAIWLGLLPWVIALPGMVLGFLNNSSTNAWALQKALRFALMICPMFVLFSSLAGLVIFCLLNTLVGLLVSRARQEPAWSIGANAGCYLAGLFPWIIAAQGLWINVFYGVVGYRGMEAYSRELENMTRIEWPILFVLILLIPTVLGIGLAICSAVVCYRHVRYACR